MNGMEWAVIFLSFRRTLPGLQSRFTGRFAASNAKSSSRVGVAIGEGKRTRIPQSSIRSSFIEARIRAEGCFTICPLAGGRIGLLYFSAMPLSVQSRFGVVQLKFAPPRSDF